VIEKDWLTGPVGGSTRISAAGMLGLPGMSALVRSHSPRTHRSLFFLCLAINLYALLARENMHTPPVHVEVGPKHRNGSGRKICRKRNLRFQAQN